MIDLIKSQLSEAITAVCQPTKIILFGSHAYGQPDIDSDIDLLIIDDSNFSKQEIRMKIRRSLSFLKYPKDILISSSNEYDFYSKEPGSVYREAYEKGVVLWSR